MRVIEGNEAKKYNRAEIRVFDCWSEFVDFGAQGPSEVNKQSLETQSARFNEPAPHWDLELGYDGAVELARNGWSDVRSEISGLADEVSSKVMDAHIDTFAMQFDVVGSAVDMGRFMTGEPECMLQPVLEQAPNNSPVVSLVIEMGCTAGVEGDTMIRRGATILALLEVLRMVRRPVDLWVSSDAPTTPRGYSASCTNLVKLVHSDEPLDIDEIAFVLAHPAAHRRIGFAAREAANTRVPDSYGRTSKTLQPYAKEFIDPTVYIPGATWETVSDTVVTDPVGWIVSTLAGAGVELKD